MGEQERGIPQQYVTEVCRIGQGARCCAFLVAGASGFGCAKGTPIEAVIRGRLVAGTMGAKGDNCGGWSKVVAAVGQKQETPEEAPDA